MIALFLLTDKVYSPQYGLWPLPWFALALPSLRLFVAFGWRTSRFRDALHLVRAGVAQSGDPAFVGYSGLPISVFEIAILIRAVILGASWHGSSATRRRCRSWS